MVSAIASRKYERAALSRLFRFTLAIQPTVRAEHRSDRRGHHVADEVFSPLGVFPKGNLTLFPGIVSPLARPSVGRVEASNRFGNARGKAAEGSRCNYRRQKAWRSKFSELFGISHLVTCPPTSRPRV